MRRAGLRPDAQTHNLVLEAVAKAARSGKAPPPSLPFPVLTGHASSLPRTNWTRFVHRTGKAGMPDAFAALRELKGSGATPDGATFRAVPPPPNSFPNHCT